MWDVGCGGGPFLQGRAAGAATRQAMQWDAIGLTAQNDRWPLAAFARPKTRHDGQSLQNRKQGTMDKLYNIGEILNSDSVFRWEKSNET